mmetsp:Transcript_115300/g.246402  ORF Transcript_115300/g.246402 Transcript_115300/m.246402 type:complete len:239 (-) Transcript_115300:831-1547(-)
MSKSTQQTSMSMRIGGGGFFSVLISERSRKEMAWRRAEGSTCGGGPEERPFPAPPGEEAACEEAAAAAGEAAAEAANEAEAVGEAGISALMRLLREQLEERPRRPPGTAALGALPAMAQPGSVHLAAASSSRFAISGAAAPHSLTRSSSAGSSSSGSFADASASEGTAASEIFPSARVRVTNEAGQPVSPPSWVRTLPPWVWLSCLAGPTAASLQAPPCRCLPTKRTVSSNCCRSCSK